MKVTSEQLLDLFGLKAGDVIRVFLEHGIQKFIVIKYEYGDYKLRSYVSGREFRDNISFLLDKDFEIIKPKPKLTDNEKVELKLALLNGFNYIIRLNNKLLYAYVGKPYKNNPTYWSYDFGDEENCMALSQSKFNFIKWEDEEPWNIKELLEQ